MSLFVLSFPLPPLSSSLLSLQADLAFSSSLNHCRYKRTYPKWSEPFVAPKAGSIVDMEEDEDEEMEA